MKYFSWFILLNVCSRPRKGAWIEIAHARFFAHRAWRRPRKGAWIEILMMGES